jgi:cytochrome c oxidase assembly protein subunit 11
VGSAPAGRVLDRTVKVRFDANVAPGLEWRFAAEAPEVEARIGETKTVLYKVRNAGPTASTGIASFNVQPGQAGAYFVKIQCFCFTEQVLQPGDTIESAVVFYVDPALADDPNLADLSSITLSYTYFPAKGATAVTAANAAKPRTGETP